MADDTGSTKTPSQYAQGRWYELLSPTQVLTSDNEEAATKTKTSTRVKRTKKCYGNRKAQRQRRKLRTVSQRSTSDDEEEQQSMQVGFSSFSISIDNNFSAIDMALGSEPKFAKSIFIT